MVSKLITIEKSLNQIKAENSSYISELEDGNIIYLPKCGFRINSEFDFKGNLSKAKNISYDFLTQKLKGYSENLTLETRQSLQTEIHNYAKFAQQLIFTLFPSYTEFLQWGRTSYRPAKIAHRKISKIKDDRKLHVDSFPATPVNGFRILRIFSNIHPDNEARVWNIGENYNDVVRRFAPKLKPYRKWQARLLRLLQLTKSLRSGYDHYQLKLHDAMKLDDTYQQNVTAEIVHFPSNTTWIAFTDQVSHAALSGQFLLEQTFYLPTHAMINFKKSPLYQWQQLNKCDLT